MLSSWTEIHNGVTSTAFSLLVPSLEGLASNALNEKGNEMYEEKTYEETLEKWIEIFKKKKSLRGEHGWIDHAFSEKIADVLEKELRL